MCIPRLLHDDLRDAPETEPADVAEVTSAVIDPAPEEAARIAELVKQAAS